MGKRRTHGTHPYAVDERLVMPETPFEILDGEVFYVPGADPPHAELHSKLSALLEIYAAPQFKAACDMLTRTSATSDFAPDASIYPRAKDPVTGGRRIEYLAFEIVSTTGLGPAGRKASTLTRRGVRRVFAIDVKRARALEWSRSTNGWEILGPDAVIDDPVLVLPLPVKEVVTAAAADDAVQRALIAKRNPVFVDAITRARRRARERGRTLGRKEGLEEGRVEGLEEGREEGRREGIGLGRRKAYVENILELLRTREVRVDAASEQKIRAATLPALGRLFRRAATCTTIHELFPARGAKARQRKTQRRPARE